MSAFSPDVVWHHGVAVVVAEAGLLILGRAGSGKTSLALAMLADAGLRGWFGRLVGDDRVALTPYDGRLVARPHERIAGFIERRGLGIVPIDHEPACVLRLVVSLVDEASALPPRHPDVRPSFSFAGVALPKLVLHAACGARENSRRVFDALTFGQTDR